MKNRTRRIENLKREIETLKEKIKMYKSIKPAFAKRLQMITEIKERQLLAWMRSE